MNRNDLAKNVYDFAAENGITMTRVQSVDLIKTVFQDVAQGVIDDGRVVIDDFGVFTLMEMKAKVGFNIHTKERITIPAKTVLRFKPSKAIKEAVR